MLDYSFCAQLTYDVANRERDTVIDLLQQHKQLQINLDNIVQIDSAGIALLVELKNIAHAMHGQITYLGATNDILKLCSLYDIEIM